MIIPLRLRITLLLAWSILNELSGQLVAEDRLIRSIEVSAPVVSPADETYWMHARPAIIPAVNAAEPTAVITMQKTDRIGTHMYHGLSAIWSSDMGKTWTTPEDIKSADRVVRSDGLLEAIADMTPQWHAQTRKLLVTGVAFLQDPKIHRNLPGGPSATAYVVYDPVTHQWGDRQEMKMPDPRKFYFARAGCTQRIDLPNGDILLPIYFYTRDAKEVNHVTVVRCGFDGKTLSYKEHGSELTVDLNAHRDRTGLYEPSLTFFGGKYLLTMRADEGAYVSVSDDGLHFSEPQAWKFDDGKLLGSYNTQQHWITHSDALYLAYTRKGADNDKIMRHRAPLFIARVDPKRLVVERATEQILLPNLGAAFGNFGVCSVSPNETWVVDCLVAAPPNAPNVYLAKIRWSDPNQLIAQ